MAFAHLSMETDSYQIFLNNFEQENALTEDNVSSAGSWEVTLDRNIDLSKLLYMKSSSAEIAVSHYTCDHLPLTISRFEKVSMKFFMPAWLGEANFFYTSYYITNTHNNQLYDIPMEDFSTGEMDTLVSFINQKISTPILHFLLRGILEPVLDNQIFLSNNSFTMSKDDCALVRRYCDIALFTRHILHDYLCDKAGIGKGNIKPKIKFKQTEFYTVSEELDLLLKSNSLRMVEDRPISAGGHMVNLPLFYGLDLKDLYDKRDGPEQKIQTDCEHWLTEMDEIHYRLDENGQRKLTDDALKFLQKLIDANKALINQAVKASNILEVINKRADQRVKITTDGNLLTLKVNEGDNKLQCNFHKKQSLKNYISDDGTSYSIFFPKLASRSLGSKEEFSIGPISNDAQGLPRGLPLFTDHIKNEEQRLHSQIRPMPKILYLVSSLINPPTCDLWLKNTPYESCRIMDCFTIDDTTVSNRFISKTTDENTYHKLSNRSLNKFVFHIVDESLNPVIWQQKTYVKLGLKVKPVLHNNS